MSVMADQDGTSNVDTAVEVARTAMRIDGKPRTFDARAIVLDHDATPRFIAFVRAVAALAAECDEAADVLDHRADRYLKSGSQAMTHYRLADRAAERRETADRLRALLAGAAPDEEAR